MNRAIISEKWLTKKATAMPTNPHAQMTHRLE
jgi:hypothetical protein